MLDVVFGVATWGCNLSDRSELLEELSLMSVLPDPDFDDGLAVLSTVLLLLADGVPMGPEVTRRWARGEEGGIGRRTTETTLCVCSQMRRNRLMFPTNTIKGWLK